MEKLPERISRSDLDATLEKRLEVHGLHRRNQLEFLNAAGPDGIAWRRYDRVAGDERSRSPAFGRVDDIDAAVGRQVEQRHVEIPRRPVANRNPEGIGDGQVR